MPDMPTSPKLIMRLLPLLSLIASSLLLTAAPARAGADLSVIELEFHGKIPGMNQPKPDEIVAPFVVAPDARLAENINDQLYIDLFQAPAPARPGKFLSEADGIVITGLAHLNFAVARNDDHILALAYDGEACGAYCEGYQDYVNFDLGSGRKIALDDLITQRGQRTIMRKMRELQRDMYRDSVAALTKQFNEEQGKPDALDLGTQDRLTLNKDCLNQALDALTALDKTKEPVKLGDYHFSLAAEQFTIPLGRCSNHAMRALDDVGDIDFVLSYADLKPHLTSYGKYLLFNEAAPPAQITPYGQMLHGQMDGKTPIAMLLYKGALNAVSGVYYYEKYRKLITLNGREQSGFIELNESMPEVIGQRQEQATMHLNINGNRLSGKWIGKSLHQVDLAP